MKLDGAAAIVTGAGKRVGRAIAVGLAKCGVRVAVHYNGSEAGAAETVRMIESTGSAARAFRADLTDPASIGPMVDAVLSHFGRLDLLVNSAASMTRTPFGSVTAAEWDAIFALNLRAPFLVAQAAAGALTAAGGAIVNIADHMGEEPMAGFLPHGVSKAAVVALTRHLAIALAPNVRVNAVIPGGVLMPDGVKDSYVAAFTAGTPLKRLGTPEDVAGAVIYLAGAAYVTGEALHVDGGRHVRIS
jgi:pteridine reductase